MRIFLKAIGVMVLLGVLYLLSWPTGMKPAALNVPEGTGLTGEFTPNTKLQNINRIELSKSTGPEDVAIGPDGHLYTGLENGDILKIDPISGTQITLGNTGGRPLGIEFDQEGDLFIADSVKGLMVLTQSGDLKTLADKDAQGDPILYADDLDVSAEGIVYFSDATTKFAAKEYGGTLGASLYEIWEGRGNGRILSYDTTTGDVAEIMSGLVFANGVALSRDEDFLVVNETGKFRALKYWLKGEKAGTTENFIDILPGYPDNINPDPTGGFFLGLVAPRTADIDKVADKPFLRNILWRVPGFTTSMTPQAYGHLVRLNEAGDVLETWQAPDGSYHDVTGATRAKDGTIFVTSLQEKSIGILKE